MKSHPTFLVVEGYVSLAVTIIFCVSCRGAAELQFRINALQIGLIPAALYHYAHQLHVLTYDADRHVRSCKKMFTCCFYYTLKKKSVMEVAVCGACIFYISLQSIALLYT